MRAASCAWVVSRGGRHIVVDPSGNFDDILHDPSSTADHQAAYEAAFASAGIPIEAIDTVLLSHIESIGLSAVRDDAGWRPFFPNARLLISDRALRSFVETPPDGPVGDAFRCLIDADRVDTFGDGDELVPGLVAEWTGMHNVGHCAFHVRDAAASATFVGHLAVTPLHLATGPCPPQHVDADGVWRWLADLASDPTRVIIGPLWPSPGACRWHEGRPRVIGGSTAP